MPTRFHRANLPPALEGVYFDFHWSQEKLWALTLAVSTIPLAHLEWSLSLPVLASDPPARIYDLCPAEVLAHPERHPVHHQRVLKADLSYPLHVMRWRGRLLVMDGFHRLLRAKLEKRTELSVKLVPESSIESISPAEGTSADFLGRLMAKRDR